MTSALRFAVWFGLIWFDFIKLRRFTPASRPPMAFLAPGTLPFLPTAGHYHSPCRDFWSPGSRCVLRPACLRNLIPGPQKCDTAGADSWTAYRLRWRNWGSQPSACGWVTSLPRQKFPSASLAPLPISRRRRTGWIVKDSALYTLQLDGPRMNADEHRLF